jgi:hypothetical protein
MRRFLLALCICLAACPACGGGAPTTPTSTAPPIDLTGTWTGDFLIGSASATMTWTLTQNNGAVNGVALVVLPTGTVLLNGVLTGTLAGSVLTYSIAVGAGGIPTQPACTGKLGGTMTATIGATSTLAGNLALTSSTCTTGIAGGNLTLTRK